MLRLSWRNCMVETAYAGTARAQVRRSRNAAGYVELSLSAREMGNGVTSVARRA